LAWDDLEKPILQAVQAHEGPWGTDVATIADDTGLDEGDVAVAVRRLAEARFVQANDASTMDGPDFISIRLLERGLQRLGEWPDETQVLAALIAALSDAADDVEDPEQRSKLLQAAGLLGGVVRDVGVRVAAEMAAKGLVTGL
jgi:hypothetical protein